MALKKEKAHRDLDLRLVMVTRTLPDFHDLARHNSGHRILSWIR
jgi:hypothetical protein